MSEISSINKEDLNSIMISTNCNALLNACDYSDEYKCLAFVSSNLIHIYDTNRVKTFLTLKEHTQRANSVRWIKSKNSAELLSCSSEGNICHWVNPSGNVFNYSSWNLKDKYTDKENNNNSVSGAGINFLNSLYISENEKYFYTFSTNGNLILWALNTFNDKYEIYARLNYKKKLQDALALMLLDDDYLLLLSGGYDNLINVHIIKRKNFNDNNNNNLVDIEYKLSIQGHNNSIRDIQIAPNLNLNSNSNINNERLFASSSQDSYIRLWSISKISKQEIDKLIENMETKKNNTIYEEYKTKMSYLFRTKDQEYYNIVLDSVLGGHEESVSSIRWGNIENKNVLLSSSFDFTLGIWKLDEQMVNINYI